MTFLQFGKKFEGMQKKIAAWLAISLVFFSKKWSGKRPFFFFFKHLPKFEEGKSRDWVGGNEMKSFYNLGRCSFAFNFYSFPCVK